MALEPANGVATTAKERSGAVGSTAQLNAFVLLKMATPRRYKDPDYLKRIGGDGVAVFAGAGAPPPSPCQLVERLRLLPADLGWSSLPWLRFLAQPTLVIAGTDDLIVPIANGRILAKLIPDARLVTVDDGHLFLVTRPKDSSAIVPSS